MSSNELNNYFESLIANLQGQKTQVIATFFCSDLNTFLLNIGDRLREALEKNIIVIIPSGNQAELMSDIWQGNNVYTLYPNVIWVGSHDEQNDINDFSNYGPLVDMFAPCKYPSRPGRRTAPAMMWVAKAASYIRGLRPDLSAEKVRLLLIDSAEDHNGFKILNFKKAKKMALKCK